MAEKIRIGIFDEFRITREGISALLRDHEEIEVALSAEKFEILNELLKSETIHVLILVVHAHHSQFTIHMQQLTDAFPRLRILIISAGNDEESVLTTIKAGAKGFLAKDTSSEELVQAIYTLRSGYDFFSNSITMLLLNKYIKKLKTDEERPDIRSLSSREIEIMKMWGNSFTNKEIADKLFLSVRTVETHKNHIMQKLNLKTSVDLVKFAIRNNIIDL
ncbi:MAG TPA: response regulator transcription factor [Bacteroidales bacterium]|nr:response regulator transcription factor [Bacteroidales bacterium]